MLSGSGGKQTLGLSLACDFHPLLFAANAGKEGFGEWADARDDALFWELLRECLLDPRRVSRSKLSPSPVHRFQFPEE